MTGRVVLSSNSPFEPIYAILYIARVLSFARMFRVIEKHDVNSSKHADKERMEFSSSIQFFVYEKHEIVACRSNETKDSSLQVTTPQLK